MFVSTFYKADPINQRDIPSYDIQINDKLPCFDSLNDIEKCYNSQAKKLELILRTSLPQAVYDRLTVEMMSNKVSFFRGTIR